jgi:hypothetical protein
MAHTAPKNGAPSPLDPVDALAPGGSFLVMAAASFRPPRRLTLSAAGLAFPLWALGCGADESVSEPPRSSTVNEQMSHTSVATDTSFAAPQVTQFQTTDVLADLHVRALSVLGGELWVGTSAGVAKLLPDGSGFADQELDMVGGAVDFALLADGRVAIAGVDRVVIADKDQQAVWFVSGQSPTAIAAHGDSVLVGSESGASRVSAAGLAPLPGLQGFAVRDLAVAGDVLYVATTSGVRRFDLAGTAELSSWRAPTELPDDDVRALAIGSDGTTLHVGTALGYARLTPQGAAHIEVAGLNGLATGNVAALVEGDGTLLLGHDIGVTVIEGSTKRHLHSLRWLPADRVTSVAIAADGTRYIGTAAGVSRHAAQAQTLAEKAELLEQQTDQYLRMGGFMANEVFRTDPWDEDQPLARSDNDNDGLWTEMQIAAWCFAYAVTKDQKYYQKARKAMDVMMLLTDVPGATFADNGMQPGFITRSLVRSDEVKLFESKKGLPNWHLQEFQGNTYLWKDDTSADEYTGHFFGIPIFYDLCAQDEAERAELRDRLARVMSYLIDNGYRLIDLDGEPTTHGDWTGLANAVDGLGPCIEKRLPKCAASFGGEGWLNSIQILGFLLATWHLTGDHRYYHEYLDLAVNQRYAEMVAPRSTTLTLTSPRLANHSDHELATLAYFTLLRYEPDAARRQGYMKALQDFYEYEKPERNALHLGLMAGAIDDVDAETAAQTLREIPIDRRLWRVDNSHRQDATLSPIPDRFGAAQFASVFPYSELGELEWNSNLFAAVQGLDGRVIQGVWPFLLPYWSLRYFRALE